MYRIVPKGGGERRAVVTRLVRDGSLVVICRSGLGTSCFRANLRYYDYVSQGGQGGMRPRGPGRTETPFTAVALAPITHPRLSPSLFVYVHFEPFFQQSWFQI